MPRFIQLTILFLVLSFFSSIALAEVALEKRRILSDQVEILVPQDFTVMSEEMMKFKYPSERRPPLVYTDEDASINLAFNHTPTPVTNDQISEYRDTMVASFKNLYPAAEWLGNEVVVKDGKNIGFLELITPAIDTQVYNLIFFTELNGKLLLGSFNCTKAQMEEWKPIAKEIMNSLRLLSDIK